MSHTLRQHAALRGAARRHSSVHPTLHTTPAPDVQRLQKLNRAAHHGAWGIRIGLTLLVAFIALAYAIVDDVPPEQRISSSEAARR